MTVKRSREETDRNKEIYVGISTFPVLFIFPFIEHYVLFGITKKYVEISMSSILLGLSSVGCNV